MKFDIPSDTIMDENGLLTPSWALFFENIRTSCQSPRPLSGTTAQRPTRYVEVAMDYYDTTVGKTIMVKSVNPIVWVLRENEATVV